MGIQGPQAASEKHGIARMNERGMRRLLRCSWVPVFVAVVSLAEVLGGFGMPSAAAEPQRAGGRPAWNGSFTEVQADRGEREYGRTCSHCHGLSLEGDGAREIPTLVSDPFMRHWRGRTVQALFDSLVRSMPADDRGTLTPQTAVDLIAYLLRANGAQAGETPLPADHEKLGT